MGLTRYINISRRLLLNQFSRELRSDRNTEYWDQIRGKHQGQRGFVVCNGPSLRMDDLTTLKDEITIASNKIYLAFDHTSWRPTFFTITNQLLAQKIAEHLHHHFCIIHAPVNIGVKFINCKTYYWKVLMAPKQYPASKTLFSNDASHGLHGGYSITYQNLQIAVHLGLNPIYLIGCDHNYRGETDPKKVGLIKTGEFDNHFIKGYRQPGEIVSSAPIERMTIAYYHAYKFGNENGIRIFNATRGGKLEVFDRINLYDVVC